MANEKGPGPGNFDEMVDHFLVMEENTPFSHLLNELVEWAGRRDGGWIADVGAGPGGLLRRVGAEKTLAIDFSLEMCKRAVALGNHAIQADARKLPLQDDSFSAVFSTNLLHLVPDPAKALEEARRVLVLGGPFLCIVPGPRMSEATLVPYLEERWGPETAEFLSGWGRSADNNRRFSETDLSDLLHAANFTDVELRPKWDGLALLGRAVK